MVGWGGIGVAVALSGKVVESMLVVWSSVYFVFGDGVVESILMDWNGAEDGWYVIGDWFLDEIGSTKAMTYVSIRIVGAARRILDVKPTLVAQ